MENWKDDNGGDGEKLTGDMKMTRMLNESVWNVEV